MDSTRQSGVQIHYQTRVDKLLPPTAEKAQWHLETNKRQYVADRIMLTTGSNPRIWDALAAMGHEIVPPVPSLFTFNIKDKRIAELPGLSVPMAELRIPQFKLQANGPLLITHWGLSGPGVLRLSAWGARELAAVNHHFELQVNWLNQSYDQVRSILQELKEEMAQKGVATRSPHQLELPNRLWQKLVEAAGITSGTRWADLSKKQIHRLSEELTQGKFSVKGKSTFKEEFVTAGGVDLREVDFKRFESKRYPGLFMAGEVLNIDAITGGFNFQAAWTGGWIAGECLGEFQD